MQVFIYRHPDAKSGEPDENRALSSKGRRHAVQLAKFLPKDTFEEVSEIWHSPFKRAAEAAAIFKKEVRVFHDVELHSVAELHPESDVLEMGKLLANCEGDVLLCGHNPYLEELVTALCAGDAGLGLINLRKGAMIALERTTDGSENLPMGLWTIEWFVPPSLLG